MREYFSQQEEEQREMRRLVEATMAGHQNTRDAKLKLQQMKHKIGKPTHVVRYAHKHWSCTGLPSQILSCSFGKEGLGGLCI